MDDRIRVSDADREQVTTRLREHYAEGRLSSDELDERISAALNAKTFGDLRGIMSDLPEPMPAPQPGQMPQWSGQDPRWYSQPPPPAFRRGPRLAPVVMLLLFAWILLNAAGGMAGLGVFRLVLLVWLVVVLVGHFGARRRRAYRRWHSDQSSQNDDWQQSQWRR